MVYMTCTSSNSSPVSYWTTWQTNRELYTWTCKTVFTIFCFQKMFKITKLVPQCFMLSIHLLVLFCVLKFYFVDFYGMVTSSPTSCLKMHVLCKVGKNIIFQNKTLLVMFYRVDIIKHFGTNFVILNISGRQFSQFVCRVLYWSASTRLGYYWN